MSLVHLDFPSGSPGMYGNNDSYLLDGVYAEASFQVDMVEDPDPGTSGSVVYIYKGSPPATLRKVLPSSQTKVGIGRRLFMPGLPTTGEYTVGVMDWRDGSNSILGTVFVDSTGRLVIKAGATTSVSPSPIIVANAWQHVEAVMDTVAGTISVRVEGIVTFSLTGLTLGGPIAQVAARVDFSVSDGASQYLKDFVIWNGAGSTNNDWMGPLQVFDLVPSSDISSGWTSTAANAWSVIDESPPSDADYIEAGASLPAAAIVGVTDLPSGIVAVKGLVTFTRAWKNDGGVATLVTGLSPNGTNWDNGSDIAVSTAATYWTRVSELSPATAAPWTPTEVNALRFRFNRTV